MDEITAHQTARQPFTDISSRLNSKSSAWDHDGFDGDDLKSPDRMSLVTSQISPRSNADTNYLPSTPGPQTPSKRVSTVSAASTILSGRGKRKTHVGPWHLGRTLGEGATGRVRLAKHAITGQEAAIKIVSKKSARMVQSESIAAMDRCAGHLAGGTARPMPCGIEREVVIMKLIEHPNVISLYDIWENRGELYLVLEYVEGGDLFSHVYKHGGLPEEEAVRLFRQIIAGLGFCHRFNICHRDLKPENILLDSWQNVKLADFGMAALQPTGHWLKTSCGSPHYAAPEITYGSRYRGDRADIWSCGIILYALLLGYLPFEGHDVPSTLRKVRMGKYNIPPEVSYEAADLIQRILQPRPEDRITVQEIFMHPLLKKYEKLHQAMSKHYVGPPPPLSVHECGKPVASVQEIDIDILRNLQTLWHGVNPEVLVSRILHLEPTQERMFYNALVRFRDEQLENYQGPPLEYSASDYHHISRRPVRARSKRSPNPRGQQGSLRRQQFSVKKQGHRRAGSIKEPMSSASYDPFRSPRNVRIPEPEYANITIHRESSASMIRTAAEDIERPANPVPGDDMEDNSECPPSSPFAVVRKKRAKANSMRTSHSRTSQASSRRGQGHAHTPRSASYRRNVSFHHIRHRSQGSASGKAEQAPPKQVTPRKQMRHSSVDIPDDAFSDRHGSPALPAQPTVVRGPDVAVRNRPQPKRLRDTDITWRDDTRQISQELSKICDEAFNGGSMSTGCPASVCGDTETPPTSVSMASPENSQHQILPTKTCSRALPDTPNSSPARSRPDLAETRRRLIEHSKQDGSDVLPSYLSGVINQLDRLIEQEVAAKTANRQEELDQPVTWLHDPFARSSVEPGHLPIISEELNNPVDSRNHLAARQSEERVPAPPVTGSQSKPCNKTTIRMVPHDSMRSLAEVKPLTIRKKGKSPDSNDSDQIASNDTDRRYASAPARSSRNISGLDPIEEHPGFTTHGDAKPPENKKWSWFRHRSHGSRENMSKYVKETKPIYPSGETVIVHDVKEPEARPSLGPTSRKSSAESIGGLFKKLIKRKPSKTALNEQPATETENADAKPTVTITANPPSSPTKHNKQKPLPHRPRGANRNTNWFARVFQIKPATRVVALNTSKIHGRKEVLRILREWKQYGLEDVYLDKSTSVIHGRVGDVNFLRLRPVEFSAEFYTVLEHGRQANLSLVRFKQERGAASSFGKVVDSLNVVMKQRKLLVEDPARAKKMSRVLDDYPN